jgi:hypothetical protein
VSARAQVRARATAAVPSQGDRPPAPRNQGTLYGGTDQPEVGHEQTVLPFRPDVENSGSLTGHILAQGWSDEMPRRHSPTVRLLLAMLIGLGVLVVIGLLVVAGIGGVFGS